MMVMRRSTLAHRILRSVVGHLSGKGKKGSCCFVYVYVQERENRKLSRAEEEVVVPLFGNRIPAEASRDKIKQGRKGGVFRQVWCVACVWCRVSAERRE